MALCKRQVRISNLPPDVSEEYLELFFESRRECPEGGSVEGVELNADGTATVTFQEQDVAARIVNSEVVLQGYTLVIEQNKPRPQPRPRNSPPAGFASPGVGSKTESMRPLTNITESKMCWPDSGAMPADSYLEDAHERHTEIIQEQMHPKCQTSKTLEHRDMNVAHISTEKLQLLKNLVENKKVEFSCQVQVIVDRQEVSLFGNEEDLGSAECEIWGLLANFSSARVDLSDGIAELLSSNKGEKWMNNSLDKLQLSAVLFSKNSVWYVECVDDQTAADVVSFFKQELTTERIPFQEHHITFLLSKEWKDIIAKLKKTDLLNISVEDEEQMIVAEGCTEAVKTAIDEITDAVKHNSQMLLPIKMKNGVFRLLKRHSADEIKDALTKGQLSGLGVEFNEQAKCIELKGLAGQVKEAENHIRKIISGVRYDVLKINEPDITHDDFDTEGCQGHERVVYLESQRKCAIEVRQARGHHASWRDLTPALPVFLPAAYNAVNAPCRTIIVERGNLPDFQKADVLVNLIAPSDVHDLSKAGAVSSAFLKAAGIQLQTDLQQKWPLKFGQDIVSTPTYGNIKAKKIYHAAIGKYRDQESCKLLREMVCKCLKMVEQEKMSSIAFPTVGCGRLKYDPALVVKTFASVQQFNNSKVLMYIVAFEDGLFKTFQSCLSSPVNDQGPPSTPASYQSDCVIEVKQGSIDKFRADVLVNLIGGESRNLNRASRISAALLRAVGPQLQTDFEAQPLPVEFGKDVCVTPARPPLQAKLLYHAAIQKYSGPNSTQLLKSMICTCLRMAANDQMLSIAFPTVGCGRLGYDPTAVTECFRHACRDTGTKLKVYVLAYEDDLFSTFAAKFSTGRKPKVDVTPQMQDKLWPIVVLHINAFDEATIRDVKKSLRQRITEMCGTTTEIKHEIISRLSRQCMQRIKSIHSQHIRIEIDRERKSIILKGNKLLVKKHEENISAILDDEAKLLSDPEHIRKVKTPKGYLLHIGSQEGVQFPSYWISAEHSATPQFTPLQATTDIYKEVEKLVLETWEQSLVGKGFDGPGLTHSKIVIKSISVVENPKLYRAYDTARKNLCLEAGVNPFPPTKGLKGEAEIKTRDVVEHLKKLKKNLIGDVNECYLFHGTSQKDSILNEGLDARLAGENSLFGKGAYFAETSTKADQYPDLNQPDKTVRAAKGKSLHMFVARVLLGNAFVCQAAQKFRKAPCTTQGCNKDVCAEHKSGYFDSVIGTHKILPTRLVFREFIVYDKSHSYPDFLVEYLRQ